MRPGSSRLAGWPTGWGCWLGGCAARTIAAWGIQTLAFLRCWREACVEVGRGARATSAEEAGVGGSAVGVRAERSCGSFSKAFAWEGSLKL